MLLRHVFALPRCVDYVFLFRCYFAAFSREQCATPAHMPLIFDFILLFFFTADFAMDTFSEC